MVNPERAPESGFISELFRGFFETIRSVGRTALKGIFKNPK